MTDSFPPIFDHTDYRAWLRAWFEAAAGRPSVRGFARRAHCSSSLVSAVLNGKRSLGLDRAERWAEQLHLDDEERRYFLAMVTLEETHSTKLREQAFETVTSIRRFRSATRVTEDTYALISRWYIGATLELASCEGWRADPAWIAEKLFPSVELEQAREALQTLESIGALARNEDGVLVPAEDLWSTGHATSNKVLALALIKQHHRVLELASHALEELPGDQRNFSTLTFALPDETVVEVKRRLHRFHEELMRLMATSKGPRSRVWHLGMQFFPMSRN